MRLLSLLLLAVLSSSTFAASLDYCLGDACLGDPLSKHLNKKPRFINSIDRKKTTPILPDCHAPVIGANQAYFVGEVSAPDRIKFSPDPAYIGKPADEYFRLTEVRTHYPKISETDVKALAEKIISRAGNEISLKKMNNIESYVASGRLKNGDSVYIVIGAERATFELKDNSDRFSKKSFDAQPGCLNTAPNL